MSNTRNRTAAEKAANRARYRAARRNDPVESMLEGARRRARARGLPFSLRKAHVRPLPTHCPVLGIPLVYRGKGPWANWATLDRLTPDLGYVPGNVQIISMRANSIKSNATADELMRVAEWVKVFT